MDVCAFGSWVSRSKMLVFSRILTALTEILGRDIRANDPRMSAGCPSQKLPLWADFSFLKKGQKGIKRKDKPRSGNPPFENSCLLALEKKAPEGLCKRGRIAFYSSVFGVLRYSLDGQNRQSPIASARRTPQRAQRSKNSISLDIFNLDQVLLISVENFNLDISISP